MLLLTTMNNMVQYQYEGNVHLVYAILRRKEIFYKLARLTLPRAIRDIKQLQKLDFYKSFGGATGSTMGAGASGALTHEIPMTKRGSENIDSEVLDKMALSTAPTDLISTTLEERDISGRVRKGGKAAHSTKPQLGPASFNSGGTSFSIGEKTDARLARMSSDFSVMDRMGSFMSEAAPDQHELEQGEGFIGGKTHEEDDRPVGMGMGSEHGTIMDSEHGSESEDEEFGAISALNMLGRTKESKGSNKPPLDEDEEDDEEEEKMENVKLPSEKSDDEPKPEDGLATEASAPTSADGTAQEKRPILMSERRAVFAAQQLKSDISASGKRDRFVPDKVLHHCVIVSAYVV